MLTGPPKSRALRIRRNAERAEWDDAWTDTGPVFTREDGTAYQPNSVSDRFDRLVERTGLPRIRLHDRRHTSASIGLASGETLKEISERLGHATLSLTADTYTHVLPAVAHESAQRRARAIPRAAAQNPPLATPARPTHDPAATPQHQVRELGRE